jgi:hypothetical protein
MNHFKSNSIPQELCPSNPDGTQFPPGGAEPAQGNWRPQAYIEPDDRPRVREGDFIGRAGSSGNSSNPHLHFSVQPVIGEDAWSRGAPRRSDAVQLPRCLGPSLRPRVADDGRRLVPHAGR